MTQQEQEKIDSLIASFHVDAANLEHISETGKINGTLYLEIKRVMNEFSELRKSSEPERGITITKVSEASEENNIDWILCDSERLLDRLNSYFEQELRAQKAAGKKFLSYKQIDDIIKRVRYFDSNHPPSEDLINKISRVCRNKMEGFRGLSSVDVMMYSMSFKEMVSEISALLQPDVNAELLETLKMAQWVIGQIRIKEDVGTQPVWEMMEVAITNYEKQMKP